MRAGAKVRPTTTKNETAGKVISAEKKWRNYNGEGMQQRGSTMIIFSVWRWLSEKLN
jgi:hypothetical protein